MHILRMLGFFSFIMAIALCVPILVAVIYSEPEMILGLSDAHCNMRIHRIAVVTCSKT